MSDAGSLGPAYRRAPLLLCLAITALVTVYMYVALAQGEPIGKGIFLCLGLLLAGAVTVEFLSEGMQFMPRELARELVGIGGLFCVFVSLAALAQLHVLPREWRGWELIVACACAFTFFLHSQRSFLMAGALQSFLMLTAILFRPEFGRTAAFGNAVAFGVAAVFVALLMALLALLFHRERAEETSTAGRAIDPRLPMRPLPVCVAVLLVLFGFFYALSPAESVTFGDIIGAGRPAHGKPLKFNTVLERLLPTEPMDDPFARWSEQTPGGPADAAQTGIAFEKDLKFGDLGSGSSHPETVVMFVRLLDEHGKVIRGEGLPLFWKTGAVYHYAKGEWTGDATLGQIAEDAQDGARDGEVRWRVTPPFGCRTEMVDQQVILWPQPTPSLFALYPAESIGLDRVYVDSEGILARTQRFDGPFKYVVRSRVPMPTPEELAEAKPGTGLSDKYMQLPPELENDAVFAAMVKDVREGASGPHARVLATMQRLEDFQYTVTPRFPPALDPTVAFLRNKRGYCQHFASALCAVLRRLRIPARIGVGFTRGEWDELRGVYIVRRKHAHAWVEALIGGIGWVPYDPAIGPATRFMVQGQPAEPLGASPPVRPERQPLAPPVDPAFPGGKGTRTTPPPPPPTSVTPPPPPPPPPPTSVIPTPPPPPTSATLPPPPPPPPPPESRPEAHEFEQLWGVIENKVGKDVPGAPSPRRQATATGGGRGESPYGDAGGSGGTGLFSRLGGAAVRIAWTLLRDLLILLCAAGLVGAVAVMILRLRRGKEHGGRGGAMVAEERYLDEEPQSEPDVLPPSGGRHPRRRRVVEIYMDFVDRLARLGLGRSPAQTATEYAAYLGERLTPCPAGVHQLTELFTYARYGDQDATQDQVTDAEDAMRDAVAEVRRARKS